MPGLSDMAIEGRASAANLLKTAKICDYPATIQRSLTRHRRDGSICVQANLFTPSMVTHPPLF